jgi:hypothetical protein
MDNVLAEVNGTTTRGINSERGLIDSQRSGNSKTTLVALKTRGKKKRYLEDDNRNALTIRKTKQAMVEEIKLK